MPQNWEQNELINLVHEVLYCDDDFLQLKRAIDNIYTIFSNISHVDAFDMRDSDYDIAISETMLACLAKEPQVKGLEYSQLIVEQGDAAMDFNHLVFEVIHNRCVSGWRNPCLWV